MKINLFPWHYFIVALILFALPAVVRAQFTYITNSDGSSITITGYNGPGGGVIIPEIINNHLVADIANGAFADNTNISSVIITNSVGYHIILISIGASAFMGCSDLTSVFLGNMVTNIGDFAFADCTNLATVYIAGNVSNIGDSAFAYCSSLACIAIQSTNITLGSLAFAYCTNVAAYFAGNAPADDGSTFYGDPGAVVYYPSGTTGWGVTFGGAPTAEQLPASDFGYETFDGSVMITGYNGPDGTVMIPPFINGYPVTTIGYHGPNGLFAYYVTNVIIPITVTSIGEDAFEQSKLTSITIPDSVTSIGSDAFYDCGSLTSVTIPGSVTNIGFDAFQLCTRLTNVTIGNGVTSIWNEAFFGCSDLANIVIPGSVTNIGQQAFELSGLTSITIPDSVTSIGVETFESCGSLTNISIDAANPVYSSLNGVLFDKAQNALIAYPSGLSGPYAIPASVTSIGVSAFQNCTSLTSVSIPGGVANIGAAAFYDCYNLTNLTITNGITSIGTWAFGYCSLVSAVIPASVTNFGSGALQECTNLTSAYFEGNAPPDLGNAFFGDPTTVYYLPGTTGWTNTYGGAPTALWLPTISNLQPSFGVQNHQFSFLISWAPNTSVIVQACTNLANPNWIPVATNTLSNGTNYFSDGQWTNYPSRFYRVSGP